MKPDGKVRSVRTFPSTLIRRCFTIFVTSVAVSAYFKRFRRIITRGKHSRSLCGPADGRGAKIPVSLSSIQCFGAFRRFRCFLGPRAMVSVLSHKVQTTHQSYNANSNCPPFNNLPKKQFGFHRCLRQAAVAARAQRTPTTP